MRTRLAILVVALVLGGLAAVLAARYLGGARASIEAESKPIEVLVAQQDIPRGTPAEELFERKLVERRQVPQQFVAAGAISSQRMIEGQVLAVPVTSGEQLTSGRFQFPSEAGLAYNVPANFVALSIPVDAVSGVSGFLRAGDNVALLTTIERGEGDDAKTVTKTIIGRARVLAVDESSGVEKAEEQAKQQQGTLGRTQRQGTKTVTLALSPTDAERAVFCVNEGKAKGDRSVWLALLPARGKGVPASAGQTLQTVLR